MGGAQRGAVYDLKFRVVKAELDKSERAVSKFHERLVAEYGELQSELRQLADTAGVAQTSLKGIGQSASQSTQQLSRQVQVLREQRAELERIAASRRAPGAAGEAFGRISTGLSSVASVVGGGPAGEAVRLAADLAGMVEQLPRLADGFRMVATTSAASETTTSALAISEVAAGTAAGGAATGIGAMVLALAPFAIAAAAITVGVLAANKALEEGRQATQAYLAVEEALAQTRVRATREEAEQRREELLAEQRVLEIRRENIQQQIEGIQARYGAGAGTDFVEETISQLLNIEGYKDLQQRLTEVQDGMNANATELQGLNDLFRRGTFATQDLAAAERALAEERVAEIARRGQIEQEILTLARTGTQEQVNSRLEQIAIERDAIRSQLRALREMDQSSEDVQRQTDELRERFNQLGAAEAALSDASLHQAIAAREAFAAVQATQEQIEELVSKRAAARTKLDGEIAAIQTESAAREEKAVSDHQEKMVGLVSTYQAEETRRLADFQRSQLRSQRAHEKNLRSAAARLDALAVIQELESYEDSRKAAEDDFDIQTRERARQLDERLAQERSAHIRSINEARAADQRRIDDLRARFSVEDAALRNEISLLRARRQEQLADLNAFISNETAIRRYGLSTWLADVRTYMQQLGGLAPAAPTTRTTTYSPPTTSVPTRTTISGGGTHPIAAMQSGGEVGRAGLYSLHAGEEVLRPDIATALRAAMGGTINQAALLGGRGGINAPITIYGAPGQSPQDIALAVRRELEDVLTSYTEGV